jgi:hypothetical protein
MIKTARDAVNINYWTTYVKTVRGAVQINYRWTPYA